MQGVQGCRRCRRCRGPRFRPLLPLHPLLHASTRTQSQLVHRQRIRRDLDLRGDAPGLIRAWLADTCQLVSGVALELEERALGVLNNVRRAAAGEEGNRLARMFTGKIDVTDQERCVGKGAVDFGARETRDLTQLSECGGASVLETTVVGVERRTRCNARRRPSALVGLERAL